MSGDFRFAEIDSDQNLEIKGLRDPVTGAYVNNATIQATMYEADGITPVSGQVWPLSLAYVPASNGDYNGILEDGRALVDGRTYWLKIVANAGGDLIKTWRDYDAGHYRVPADDA